MTTETIFNGITFAYNAKAAPVARTGMNCIVIRWKSEKGSNVPARPPVAIFTPAIPVPNDAGVLSEFYQSAILDAQRAIVRNHLDALIAGNNGANTIGVTISNQVLDANSVATWHSEQNMSVLERFSSKIVEDWFKNTFQDNLTLTIITKMEAAGLDAGVESKKIERVVEDVRINLLKMAGKGTAKSLDDRKIDALCKLVVANTMNVDDAQEDEVAAMLVRKMHNEMEARSKVAVDLGEFI